MMVRKQTVDGGRDLNHLAVWAAIDRFPGGVKDPWGCLEKVRRVFYRCLEEAE